MLAFGVTIYLRPRKTPGFRLTYEDIIAARRELARRAQPSTPTDVTPA